MRKPFCPLLVAALACIFVQSTCANIDRTLEALGLQGGLVVQIGADDTTDAAALSKTGRYIINILDPDQTTVTRAQSRLRQTGNYGVVSVERLPEPESSADATS